MFKILFCGVFLLLPFGSKAQATAGSCAALQLGAVVAPVFTSFDINGALKLDGIPAYAQNMKDNGILDVILSLFVGEGASLNLCEREALIRAWVNAASPLGIGVLVQITGLPFTDVLILAQLCVELNVKAIVVEFETNYPPDTVEEALADLQLIADIAVGIPIIFNSGASEIAVSVSVVDLLISAVVQIPCLRGVITVMNTAFTIKAAPALIDIIIIIEGHETISAALQLNLIASSSLINLYPGLVLDIVAAVQAGNLVLASELQAELNVKVAAVTDGVDLTIRSKARVNIVKLKVALELISGLKIAIPRVPLVAANLELVTGISLALAGVGVALVGTVEGVLGLGVFIGIGQL